MWRTLFTELLFLSISAAAIIANEQNKVCSNEQCVLAGDLINKIINKATNPCDDFYNYACGNWQNSFPMPSNEDVWNIDKMVEHSAKLELKEILEAEEAEDDFIPLKYEKWWYKSCMDSEKIEESGVKPMEEILEKFGGWPMVMPSSDWNDENHEWQGIHEFYTEYRDLSSLFNIQVSGDQRSSDKNVINLNKPGETLLDDLLKKGEEASMLQKYGEFIKNVTSILVKLAGKTVADEDIAKDVDDLITFEKSLRMIKVSANETEDLESLREYMSIDKLQEYYDQETDLKPTAKINWLETLSFPFKKIENVTVDNLEDIGVEDKYFIQKLSHLLSDTPNRVIVNYVHWKFISSLMEYTNKEMRDLYHQLLLKPEEPEVSQERWEECVSDMKLSLGHKYEYVRRHYNEDVKKLVSDIASEMRGEMLDEIEHSNWIDDSTKEESMVKLRALKWQSGNSHLVFNRDHLQLMYNGLTVTSNYFDNEMNYREFHVNHGLKRLRNTRNHHRFVRMDPMRATAIYDRVHNVMALTAAQLSVPLIHSSLPLSVSYGFIAPTMGQLMSRTLEKEVHTNVYMPPWSSYLGETYKTYEPKTACLTSQYYNYSVGPATLDENVYDAIGLKVAYNAFQNSFNHEGDAKLPELEELTDDQLFFVSYALNYCQASTPKYQTEHDPAFETPNEYRVAGTVSNSEYFAKAFGCAPNSPMNPETKCTL